jgi:hypothetical protein
MHVVSHVNYGTRLFEKETFHLSLMNTLNLEHLGHIYNLHMRSYSIALTTGIKKIKDLHKRAQRESRVYQWGPLSKVPIEEYFKDAPDYAPWFHVAEKTLYSVLHDINNNLPEDGVAVNIDATHKEFGRRFRNKIVTQYMSGLSLKEKIFSGVEILTAAMTLISLAYSVYETYDTGLISQWFCPMLISGLTFLAAYAVSQSHFPKDVGSEVERLEKLKIKIEGEIRDSLILENLTETVLAKSLPEKAVDVLVEPIGYKFSALALGKLENSIYNEEPIFIPLDKADMGAVKPSKSAAKGKQPAVESGVETFEKKLAPTFFSAPKKMRMEFDRATLVKAGVNIDLVNKAQAIFEIHKDRKKVAVKGQGIKLYDPEFAKNHDGIIAVIKPQGVFGDERIVGRIYVDENGSSYILFNGYIDNWHKYCKRTITPPTF